MPPSEGNSSEKSAINCKQPVPLPRLLQNGEIWVCSLRWSAVSWSEGTL